MSVCAEDQDKYRGKVYVNLIKVSVTSYFQLPSPNKSQRVIGMTEWDDQDGKSIYMRQPCKCQQRLSVTTSQELFMKSPS